MGLIVNTGPVPLFRSVIVLVDVVSTVTLPKLSAAPLTSPLPAGSSTLMFGPGPLPPLPSSGGATSALVRERSARKIAALSSAMENFLGRRITRSFSVSDERLNSPSAHQSDRLAVRRAFYRETVHVSSRKMAGRNRGLRCGGMQMVRGRPTGQRWPWRLPV